MIPDIFKLKPIQYLCPFCGEWHDYPTHLHPLDYYIYPRRNDLLLRCTNPHYSNGRYEISGGIIPFECIIENLYGPKCSHLFKNFLYPKQFEKHLDQPIITASMYAKKYSKPYECSNCKHSSECPYWKSYTGKDLDIALGFKFNESEYKEVVPEFKG